jgi:hypothetical protein
MDNMETDMTRVGTALFAALAFSAGPALACGQAYSTNHGYHVVHHSRAAYEEKDAGYRRTTNLAAVALTKSPLAEEAPSPQSPAAAPLQCKEYSATVGYMISVPCPK